MPRALNSAAQRCHCMQVAKWKQHFKFQHAIQQLRLCVLPAHAVGSCSRAELCSVKISSSVTRDSRCTASDSERTHDYAHLGAAVLAK